MVKRGLQDRRYISPQKLMNERNHLSTKADDVYAFGLVLWELAGGKELRIPTRLQIPAILADMKKGIRENIPKSLLEPLIRRCWQFEPVRRPSFSEVLRDGRKSALSPEQVFTFVFISTRLCKRCTGWVEWSIRCGVR